MNLKVCPSVLAADFGHLGQELRRIANGDCIHVDIMDGHFVPNISFGPMVAGYIKANSELPLDIHLMIEQPDKFIPDFLKLNPEYLTVHYEACTHLHRVLSQIKEGGAKAGIALNPHTPVSLLEPILDLVDLVLIMTVNPGFGGQSFIPASSRKIQRLKQLIGNNPIEIQVDGGVSLENASYLRELGVTMLVAGSAIFGSSDPEKYIEELRRAD